MVSLSLVIPLKAVLVFVHQVIHGKLDCPSATHKLFMVAEQTDIVCAMIDHWLHHLKGSLVHHKTHHSEVKKFADGKVLAEIHEQSYNEYYWYGRTIIAPLPVAQ